MTGGPPAHRRPSPAPARYWLRRLAALGLVALLGVLVWWVAATGFPSGPEGASVATPSSSLPSTSRPVGPSPEPTAPPLPVCVYADEPAERAGYKAWKRTLLDTRYALPQTYEPPGLLSATEAGFDQDLPIRSLVIEDLAALREAADAAGNPVELIAAYRSFDQQAVLFEQREEELGHDEALQKAARPGHSEHQIGTAVDFKLPGHKDVREAFGSTRAGKWLAENSWEFGFVLSYPRDLQDITCYAYEPWHFRYFGREMAAQIHGSGLTVREYLWALGHGVSP